jgi:hypothetical protein
MRRPPRNEPKALVGVLALLTLDPKVGDETLNISDLEACPSTDLLLDLQAIVFVRRLANVLVGIENGGCGEVGVCGKD